MTRQKKARDCPNVFHYQHKSLTTKPQRWSGARVRKLHVRLMDSPTVWAAKLAGDMYIVVPVHESNQKYFIPTSATHISMKRSLERIVYLLCAHCVCTALVYILLLYEAQHSWYCGYMYLIPMFELVFLSTFSVANIDFETIRTSQVFFSIFTKNTFSFNLHFQTPTLQSSV